VASINWDKIKNEYITTTISTRKLAGKYNVPYSTLRDRSTRERWSEQREVFRSKVVAKAAQKTEKIAEKVADEIASRNQAHIEVWDLLGKRAKNLLESNGYTAMTKEGPEHVDLDPDGLERLSRAIDKVQRGHRLALGMDKPNTSEEMLKTAQELKEAMLNAATRIHNETG